MRQADYFNEAVLTAMLASGARDDGVHAPDAFTRSRAAPGTGDGGGRGPGAPDDKDLTRAGYLRTRLLSLLDESRRRAVMDGIPPDYAETADFAVCAFIDETLLSSVWNGRDEWMTRPLQLERHMTGTAGEGFYRILDELLKKAENGDLSADSGDRDSPQSRKALESTLAIFALCLAQGFTGMYFHDPDTVRSYRKRIGQAVPEAAAQESGTEDSLFLGAGGPSGSSSFFQRFDLLDWMLWLAPVLITAVLYHICDRRLDVMLGALLQKSALP
jgi:type VI secretion system protein ImpK